MKHTALSRSTMALNEATRSGGPGSHGARVQYVPPRLMSMLSILEPVQISSITVSFNELYGLRGARFGTRIKDGATSADRNSRA